MNNIEGIKIKDKKLLVRVDLNVPLDKEGKVLDDFRIKSILPSIRYFKRKQAKVILISHLGRPSGKDKKYSLRPIAAVLSRILKKKVRFLPDCIGRRIERRVNSLLGGEIVLLENLRFYKGETKNDFEFAKALSRLGEIYVNDAFSVSHREHASIVGIPRILPSFAGFLLRKEIENLSKIKNKPRRPLVIIIGGKKLSKIKFLPRLLEMSDSVLLNGFLSEIILIAKDILIGRPYPDSKLLDSIKKFDLTDTSLHLPNNISD